MKYNKLVKQLLEAYDHGDTLFTDPSVSPAHGTYDNFARELDDASEALNQTEYLRQFTSELESAAEGNPALHNILDQIHNRKITITTSKIVEELVCSSHKKAQVVRTKDNGEEFTEIRELKPLLLWGSSGVGKTGIIADVVERRVVPSFMQRVTLTDENIPENEREDPSKPREFIYFNKLGPEERRDILERVKNNTFPVGKYYFFIDFNVGTKDPIDIAGQSTISDTKSQTVYQIADKFYEPALVLGSLPGSAGTIFLDEINQAAMQTLLALYKPVQDKTYGELQLGHEWTTIAAANMYGSDTVTELPPALAQRFDSMYMFVDPNHWFKYAERKKIHPLIIDFLKVDPMNFMNFEADPDVISYQSIPNVRNFEAASDKIKMYEYAYELMRRGVEAYIKMFMMQGVEEDVAKKQALSIIANIRKQKHIVYVYEFDEAGNPIIDEEENAPKRKTNKAGKPIEVPVPNGTLDSLIEEALSSTLTGEVAERIMLFNNIMKRFNWSEVAKTGRFDRTAEKNKAVEEMYAIAYGITVKISSWYNSLPKDNGPMFDRALQGMLPISKGTKESPVHALLKNAGVDISNIPTNINNPKAEAFCPYNLFVTSKLGSTSSYLDKIEGDDSDNTAKDRQAKKQALRFVHNYAHYTTTIFAEFMKIIDALVGAYSSEVINMRQEKGAFYGGGSLEDKMKARADSDDFSEEMFIQIISSLQERASVRAVRMILSMAVFIINTCNFLNKQYPRYVEDPQTGEKIDIYLLDDSVLRKMRDLREAAEAFKSYSFEINNLFKES